MHSVEELLEAVKGYDTKEVYVIGGSSVYEQLLPYCDTAHVTKIDHAYEADSWFPNLDEDPDWEITADSDEQYYFDLTYHSLNMSAKGLSTDGSYGSHDSFSSRGCCGCKRSGLRCSFYRDSCRCLLGDRTALCCHVRESFAATAFSNSSPIKNHAGAKSRRITWLMFQGLFW